MRTLLLATLCACLALPSAALAASGTGGVSPDVPGASQPGASEPSTPAVPTPDPGASNGGVSYGAPLPDTPRSPAAPRKPSTPRKPAAHRKPLARRHAKSGRPLLQLFQVSRASLFVYGAPANVSFRIADRSPTVRVRLQVIADGTTRPLRTIDLGDRPTGSLQTYSFDGREGGTLPQGSFRLRLTARDPGGRPLRTGAQASNVDEVSYHWHRFPLAGDFTYGEGADGRFGASRDGHTHQGQDIAAPEGTPVLAPRGGRIEYVNYQAGGAGYYVVLDGEGEDRDYAFMHLKKDSVLVKPGQIVSTGQQLAEVGSTGDSTGPHLHFEVWEGGHWWAGGKPVDPLPYLRRWDSWS